MDPAERDRCLPGLSAGLATMVAVIANRFVRGLLDPVRFHEQLDANVFGNSSKIIVQNWLEDWQISIRAFRFSSHLSIFLFGQGINVLATESPVP